jgi:hypothetical protein
MLTRSIRKTPLGGEALSALLRRGDSINEKGLLPTANPNKLYDQEWAINPIVLSYHCITF